MLVRDSIVAGKFYPSQASELKKLMVETYLKEEVRINKKLEPKKIIGGILPHAGYIYSAPETIHLIYYLKHFQKDIDTIIIVNPNHHGLGEEVEIDDNEAWSTPLGTIELDTELKSFINIPKSTHAQMNEHSAEVIVPYLQYFIQKEFKILPVCIKKQSYKNAKLLAEALFKANQVVKRNIVMIASSDFSHYVRPEVGFYNDNLVLNRIRNNSIHGLYDTIIENNISVCGYGPIMTLMFYSRMVEPDYKVEILARGNSGRETNDDLVVDYISALFYR